MERSGEGVHDLEEAGGVEVGLAAFQADEVCFEGGQAVVERGCGGKEVSAD